MRSLLFLILTALVVLSPGCAGGGQAEPAAGNRAGRLHTLAESLRTAGAASDTFIAVQQQAVDELRRTGSPYAVEILSQAGYYYCRVGDYVRGLDYLMEASDSLAGHVPQTEADCAAALRLYGNRANLYSRLGVYDEALKCYDEAMKYATGSNRIYLPDLWRFRGECFSLMGEPESLFYCNYKGIETVSDNPRLSNPELTRAHLARAQAWYLIEHADQYPDSLAPAVKALERINADSLGSLFKSGHMFILGQGYAELGNPAKGIPMMEEALRTYREREDKEMVAYGDKMLLHTYATLGDYRRMGPLYLEYEALADSQERSLRSDAVLGAEFRYRIHEKEAELERARATEHLHNRMIAYLWIAVALGALLTIGASVITVRHVRRMRQQRRELKRRIESLLTRQKNANAATEQLQEAVERLGKELQDRERREQEINIGNLVKHLTPSPLTDETERELRRSFEVLYPHFLRDLRKDYPQLTPSDELLCMLIYMHQNNEGIALCLGITRMSVNTARFRLRKKLGLDKETDLNDFLTSRQA